jgi:hypothetical protein
LAKYKSDYIFIDALREFLGLGPMPKGKPGGDYSNSYGEYYEGLYLNSVSLRERTPISNENY